LTDYDAKFAVLLQRTSSLTQKQLCIIYWNHLCEYSDTWFL